MDGNAEKKRKISIEIIVVSCILAAVCAQAFFAWKWICGTGLYIQKFQETSVYIQNAGSLTCNGWFLIGYSLFLRCFMKMGGSYGLGSREILFIFLIQFSGAFISFSYLIQDFLAIFLRKRSNWAWSFLTSLFICTFPGMLQMICSVLPDIWIQIIVAIVFVKGTKLVFKPHMITGFEMGLAGLSAGVLCMVKSTAFLGILIFIFAVTVVSFISCRKRVFFKQGAEDAKAKEKKGKFLLRIMILWVVILCSSVTAGIINYKTVQKADNYMKFEP